MKVTSLRYLDAKFHHPSPKIKKIPKNTNGRLAIPALAGLLVFPATTLTFSHSSFLFLTFVFIPWDFYSLGQKNNNNNTKTRSRRQEVTEQT